LSLEGTATLESSGAVAEGEATSVAAAVQDSSDVQIPSVPEAADDNVSTDVSSIPIEQIEKPEAEQTVTAEVAVVNEGHEDVRIENGGLEKATETVPVVAASAASVTDDETIDDLVNELGREDVVVAQVVVPVEQQKYSAVSDLSDANSDAQRISAEVKALMDRIHEIAVKDGNNGSILSIERKLRGIERMLKEAVGATFVEIKTQKANEVKAQKAAEDRKDAEKRAADRQVQAAQVKPTTTGKSWASVVRESGSRKL